MSDSWIGWYVGAAGASTASIRLRCLVPMAELGRRGWRVAFSQRGAPQPFDAVVFSKIYDGRAQEAAREMRARGVRIILDLCDNHWFGEEEHPAVFARARRLEQMLGTVDLITASTPLLAKQIATRFDWPADAIRVVPDPVLAPQPSRPSLRGQWEMMLLQRRLNRNRESSHLIWFGNHGAGHVRSGMEDLNRIRSIIDIPDGRFTLTVVSNSHAKFRKLFGDWQLPKQYVPWRLDTIESILGLHDAAVIPITCNAFTAAKTINRPATALMAGLEVFADRIPSYDELTPFITLDDWAKLRCQPPYRAEAADPNHAARDYLMTHYSAERVAICWSEAVDQALS